MRVSTFSARGRELSSPPGESILHLAEIVSRGEEIFSPGETLKLGNFISGHWPYGRSNYTNQLQLTGSER